MQPLAQGYFESWWAEIHNSHLCLNTLFQF
jgi:hypothetical protein